MTPLRLTEALQLPLPDTSAVDVWQINLDDAGWQSACHLLAPDEELRAARFVRAIHGQRYRHGRAVLRRVLAAYAGHGNMLITYGAYGKPALAGGELQFNVSHSEGLALIAVGALPLGVDIEYARRPGFDITTLVRQICSAEELQQLQHLPLAQHSECLYRLWTQKEAWSKAHGSGLQQDFSRLQLGLAGSACCLPLLHEGQLLHVHTLPAPPGFYASLCHPAPVLTVQCRLAEPAV